MIMITLAVFNIPTHEVRGFTQCADISNDVADQQRVDACVYVGRQLSNRLTSVKLRLRKTQIKCHGDLYFVPGLCLDPDSLVQSVSIILRSLFPSSLFSGHSYIIIQAIKRTGSPSSTARCWRETLARIASLPSRALAPFLSGWVP